MRACIAVGVPNLGTWTNDTARSVSLMMCYFAIHRPEGYKEHQISLITLESSMLSSSREKIVRQALKNKEYTHLMWVDSDMKVPMDTIHRLLAHDKDFVAANCTTRKPPIEPVAHGLDGKRMYSVGKKGLEEAQHVGLAVALVKLEPLKRLRPPLFLMDWIPDIDDYCGEDVYFTQKLRELGISLWVDHEVSLGVDHVGSRAYGHADVVIPKEIS